MIDRRRIEDLLRNLDNFLDHLHRLSNYSREDLTNDPINLGAAKYYLQVSVESCVNVANHIISKQNWRRPESMADSFSVLAENGAVDPSFLPTLHRMARFRNRLVHLYWEVEADTIYQILNENLEDLENFERNILVYITKS